MHAAMAMASKKIDGIDSYTYELFDVLEVKRERSYVFDAISELNNIENVKIEIDPRGHGLTNMVAAIQNQINIMNLPICFVCDWWFVLVFLLRSFMYTWHWQRLCYDFLLSLHLFFFCHISLTNWQCWNWSIDWNVIEFSACCQRTHKIQWTFCRAFLVWKQFCFCKIRWASHSRPFVFRECNDVWSMPPNSKNIVCASK